ncbi:hypothetical protein NMG60_11028408 [Bertholletia excelsa]
MGCATSKPVCRKCKAMCSPPRRSYSVHPQKERDSCHLVALTSSTLGSLRLELESVQLKDDDDEKSSKEFSMELIEAKTWSKMIDEKIPKIVPRTPIMTPPGEPETINAWELMEGLDDISPLRPVHHSRSFSFHVPPDQFPSPRDFPAPKPPESDESSHNISVIPEHDPEQNGESSPKKAWFEMGDNESSSNSNDKSVISEFDPEVIAEFRRSLDELPPANQIHLKPMESTDEKKIDGNKDRVVLYFTSLRGVRKTYEDCCQVRMILKAIGVWVDERDVSMHSEFKEELRELLEDGFSGAGLPAVLVGQKYIGGADDIRRLHEEGQLEKMLDCCETADDGGGTAVCETCGDIRFVPCDTCSGSCKIYYEGDCEEEGDETECGFHRCPDCNENGIVRCPICCR